MTEKEKYWDWITKNPVILDVKLMLNYDSFLGTNDEEAIYGELNQAISAYENGNILPRGEVF